MFTSARLGIPTQKVSDAVRAARAEVHQNGQSLTPAQRADEFANAVAGKLGMDPVKDLGLPPTCQRSDLRLRALDSGSDRASSIFARRIWHALGTTPAGLRAVEDVPR